MLRLYRSHLLPSCTLALMLAAPGCAGSDGGGPIDAGPPAVDQCLSDGDRALTRPDSGIADGGNLSDVGTTVKACALGPCLDLSLGNGDPDPCIRDCMAGTEYASLTEGCLDCYIETFFCGREYCTLVCLGNDDVGCGDCINANCTPRFLECSGLDPVFP